MKQFGLFHLVLFYISVFIHVIPKLVFPHFIHIVSWDFSFDIADKTCTALFKKIFSFLKIKVKKPFL